MAANKPEDRQPENLQPEDREIDSYVSEKEEEGRRINEGKAHKPDEPASRSFRGMQATRAVMRDADRDVPPDAEGQERSGHIEQTITPDGGTQTR
jgi:hypothetical protein